MTEFIISRLRKLANSVPQGSRRITCDYVLNSFSMRNHQLDLPDVVIVLHESDRLTAFARYDQQLFESEAIEIDILLIHATFSLLKMLVIPHLQHT